MKKKILFSILILLLLIFSAALILPYIYKDEIKQKITEEINKNLNAKVRFGDVDLSVIRSFPHLNISISNLKVSGVDEFVNDTLANIKDFRVSVDIMSVIRGGQIKIRSIYLQDPKVFAKVLKNGKSNWDITKPSKETAKEEAKFKVALQKYEIENGRIIYDDQSMGFRMRIVGFNHKGKGDFTQDLFLLETQSESDSLSVYYGAVKYLSNVHATIKADLEMDMKNFKFTFKNNEFGLNELLFGFDGFVAMPGEDIDMDLRFNARKNEFRNFISILPAVYTKDFSKIKSSGKLSFDGKVKGKMSEKTMPSFDINLQIENGMFKYPELPTEIRNVGIKLNLKNPDGVPDHTIINLSQMHIEAGTEPFDAKLIVRTPISDADIDASMKGKINFENIRNMVPLEKGTELKGLLMADIAAKGRMSSIEKKKYEDFKASGKFELRNFRYADASLPSALEISEMLMEFNPKSVNLTSFVSKIGKTDIRMKGLLENFIPYAIKNETLRGSLDISSNMIDLNEFMSPSSAKTEAKPDSMPMNAIKIPGNIDFTTNFSAGTILYDNMTLNNFKGKVVVKDESLKMENISLQSLDGSINVNGNYNAKDINSPQLDFSLEVSDIDIQKTIKTFNTIKKLAPVGEKCVGKISSKLHFTTKLDKHMEVNLSSLNGSGNLKTKEVVINNFEPLVKLAENLKMDKFKKMDLKDLNISFKFMDGKVYIDPFTFNTGNLKTIVQGSNGFDQTINYVVGLEIPRAELGSAANEVMTGLIAKANQKGGNFSMGDKINVDALIGGTVMKPVVSTNLKGAAKSAVEDLKSKAMEEIEKKKKEAEEKLKAEADKIKKSAEEKINAEKEKLKGEADRLKQEAADKLKAEQDKIKQEVEKKKKEAEEKAKNEAKNKLKNLFK